jgi:hypothetical protein
MKRIQRGVRVIVVFVVVNDTRNPEKGPVKPSRQQCGRIGWKSQ